MELIVSATGLELPSQTIRSLSQRLDLAVDRLESTLQKINVQLERKKETLGPGTERNRRELNLACRIQLTLENDEPITLEDMDNDLNELLDRITERLGVIVSKRADDSNLVALIRKSRAGSQSRFAKTWDNTTVTW